MFIETILAINWPSVGLKIAQLLLSLSILVILHEFGHYITAKWFKCRVEKFYLFFDAGFSLFKRKIGETEYGIGWLPLGGYVKIAGMVDESMDKEQMKQPPKEYEFRSKPAWQRLIIMLGGVTVNVLVAFILYAMISMIWGEKKIESDSLKYGISFNDSILQKLGFQNGDNIVSVDGKKVEDFVDAQKKLLVVDDSVTVIRNGQTQVIKMPVDLIGQIVERKKKTEGPFMSPRTPVIVLDVEDTSNAFKAGLKKGDVIQEINGVAVAFYDQFTVEMKKKKKGDSLSIKVNRNDSVVQLFTVVENDGKVGFAQPATHAQFDSLGIFKYTVTKYGLLGSIPAGVKRAGRELKFYAQQFAKILNPKTGGYKGLGGFKGMASGFDGSGWNWEGFWTMTALFSIILAFMNLLPIPALDGGHVLFTLIEMITGRKPNEKVLEYAQIAGMIILLGLMLYANLNDWIGWGKGN